MAAEILSELGHEVHLFDAMPSVGRKFLLAGKGGLNLTHSEEPAKFLKRYADAQSHLEPLLTHWGANELRAWAASLGVETFVGTSGRVFPKEMKAAPLLRSWLNRLRHPTSNCPVQFHMRHRLTAVQSAKLTSGQSGCELTFEVTDLSTSASKAIKVNAQAVLLALGGGSWARLGSDGKWVAMLEALGVPVQALESSNCGFHVAGREGQGWTSLFKQKFAGQALKSVVLQWTSPKGLVHRQQGEFVVTDYGVEGSLIYAASADLRQVLKQYGRVNVQLDLLPGRTFEQTSKEAQHPRGSKSLSSHLKSRLGLEGVKMGLLHEFLRPEVLQNPESLSHAIKGLDIQLTATRPMDEAISTAGGVKWHGLQEKLQLQAMPGVFCAGEMLDWEAPTGGYLLTACMSTAVHAAKGLHAYLQGHASLESMALFER
jgi:uncharacterized flavoprotein (TIGR03862 family)